ncbi:major intrinsic protein domain-containing protein [Phthorimaea operculella]|nr:major intrinsic protein domain-containing protein [Phthorimaea operculella]
MKTFIFLTVSVPGYAGSLSASIPGGGGAAWERLGIELVLSGLVAGAYFAAMERRWTGAAPALIGAAYCAASLVSMPSLNPARSLGPSFVLSRWESHWVCWVGGIGGGLACGLLHEWGSRRSRGNSNSRASSPRDLDELDKPSFPTHYRHAPTYCSAAAPRPDNAEPLYSGTKSLYCRSPPPTRHTLHRSQSVYSKGSSTTTGGPLISAQSLLLRPPVSGQHALTHNQNTHNAQRDPAYGTAGTVRPGPAGAPMQERRDSVYSGSTRRGPLSSDDSAYGTYTRAPYRGQATPAHVAHPMPPDHY